MKYDLVILNGLIIDGNNKPIFKANIGIKKNKISIITNKLINGNLFIDARNKIVCPGFIDIHSHSDDSFIYDSRLESKIHQGVTTEIVGNCGESIFPKTNKNNSLGSLKEFIKNNRHNKMAINWGTLIGHNSVRISVMGYDSVTPTNKDLNKMKKIIRKGLKEGAFGMSLGLIYPPGFYAQRDELIELAKVVKKHKGILTVHMRNEGDHLIDSINEILDIQEKSKAHVHISHLKATGKQKGTSKQIINFLDQKINEGFNLSMDAYPYDSSFTTLKVLLPNGFANHNYEYLEKYNNPELLKFIKDNIVSRGGSKEIFISNIKDLYPMFEGKSLHFISKKLKITPEKAVVKMIIESKDSVSGIYHMMDNNDVINFIMYKNTAIVTDANAFSFNDNNKNGLRHPRAFGTYPKFIRMVLDNNYISLEEAIYKITFLPAKTVSIKNKGLIKEKYDADIVIFDKNNIKDLSTYDNIFQKPKGIEYVIVNGKITIQNGIQTSNRSGRFLIH